MKTISASVGTRPKSINNYDDVVTIQEILNELKTSDGGANPKLKVDGKCGAKTTEAIQKFQLRHFGWKLADGRVDPGGPTWNRMRECLGGISSWAKSMRFRIRRQVSDSTPARLVRIPGHDGQDSGAMADTLPVAWRTGFRPDGGHFRCWTGRLSAMISERCPR